MVKWNFWIMAKKWLKRILCVGLPLLLPLVLDLMGKWQDITLGALLSLIVYGITNKLQKK